MAVGLVVPEVIHSVKGVRLASHAAKIRKSGEPDLVLFEFSPDTSVAAVFTRNAFCAAPVSLAREHLRDSPIRALLINAGNANAGTGSQGLANARKSCEAIAGQLSISPEEVLPFSTGVISEQLPMEKLLQGIAQIGKGLSEDGWLAAAKGIMTTDTLPKIVSKKADIGGKEITVTGIAKGAGMICPDMATMLAFIVTDAKVVAGDLQDCLDLAVRDSFNAISVDGDTSTNDACVLAATGQAGGPALTRDHPAWKGFQVLIDEACQSLAQAIVRDGEGATKFMTLNITQGRDENECRQVAYTIAHSPLVKTAFFASDPNVGRLLAAVGRSRLQDLDIATVDISLDEVDIVIGGEPANTYTEELGQMVMNRQEITVNIALGRGQASSTVWTCDLSSDYVRINADYRS